MMDILIATHEVKYVLEKTAAVGTFSHTVQVCLRSQNGSVNRAEVCHGEAAAAVAVTSPNVCG